MGHLPKLFNRRKEGSPTASPSSSRSISLSNRSLSVDSSRTSTSSSCSSPSSSRHLTEKELSQNILSLQKVSPVTDIQPVSPEHENLASVNVDSRSSGASFRNGKSFRSQQQYSPSSTQARMANVSPRSSPEIEIVVEMDGPVRSDAKWTRLPGEHAIRPNSSAKVSSQASPVSVLDVHSVGAEYQELVDAFTVIDANKDGKISEHELGEVLRLLGVDSSDKEIHLMMLAVDTDGDGQLDLNEFICHNTLPAGREESTAARSAELRAAFHLFDIDKNNFISAEELHQVLQGLGEQPTMEECCQMISGVDCDGDGQVNFEEFERMMTSS